MSCLPSSIQTERRPEESAPEFEQESVDPWDPHSIADEAEGVARRGDAAHDLFEAAMDRWLAAGEGEVIYFAIFRLADDCLQNLDRQVACGRVALREAVSATQVAAIGQLDDEARHETSAATELKRRTTASESSRTSRPAASSNGLACWRSACSVASCPGIVSRSKS